MKIKKILLCLLILACSCVAWAANLGPQEAESIARQWFTSLTAHAHGKFLYSEIKTLPPVVSGDETVLYIINLEQGGWIIVSADDRVEPVLAYSYRGSFENRGASSGAKTIIENHCRTIRDIMDGKIILPSLAPEANLQDLPGSREMSVQAVEPLVSSMWEQDTPYNQDCPLENGLPTYVGCGALSSGQIMHYWQYPPHGTGSYNGIDYQNTYYQWQLMPTSLDLQSPQAEIDAVAQLLYHIGVGLDMRYHSGSASLSADSDIDDVFRDFYNYSATFDYGISIGYSNLPGVVRQDLDKGWPVQFNGYSATYGGHAYVCDGYEVRGADTYLHFNFGWGGVDNGYYKLFSVNCPETGYDFNKKYTIVHYIRPNKTLVAAGIPSSRSLTLEQSSQQTFTILADHKNGSPLTYQWRVDNNLSTCTTKSFSYIFPELRDYTITGTVGDGTLSEIITWTVHITAPTPDEILPPTSLTAAGSPSEITLSWVRPNGAKSIDLYHIYRNNTLLVNVPGEQTTYLDMNFAYDTDYQYYVTAHYTFPEAESAASNVIMVNVPAPPAYFEETFESGSFSPAWVFAGPANWKISSTSPADGVYCALSPSFSVNGSADISFQYHFPTAGTISFKKRVYTSLYSSDYFKFYIDGQLIKQWKEQTAWATVSFPVPAGLHTFKWSYEKTGFVSSQFYVKIDTILANPGGQ